MESKSYLAIAVVDKDSQKHRFSVIVDVEIDAKGNLVFSQEGIVYDSSSEDRPKRYDVDVSYFTQVPEGG